MAKKQNNTPQAPRQLDEITKDYKEVGSAYASASYQAFVQGKEATRLAEIMSQLASEASARQDLDQQVAAAAKGTENV